jgi:hypothetical protein
MLTKIIALKFGISKKLSSNVSFFKSPPKTEQRWTADGKPDNFDPANTQLYLRLHRTRRTNGCESFGTDKNGLYNGDYGERRLSLRIGGAVLPLRKVRNGEIHLQKIGIINIRDQAMAVKRC